MLSSVEALLLFTGSLVGIVWLCHSPKYPPGPSASWVIGNLHDLPVENEWNGFSKLSKKYGPCMHLQVFTQHIIVLNTVTAARDLLEKQSANYSSRPRLVMAGEMVQFADALALMPYNNNRFNQIRKLIHKEFSGIQLTKYRSIQEHDSYVLVEAAVRDPANLLNIIRRYAGSTILKISFGYQTQAQEDPFLLLAEKVMSVFAEASQPGKWLVDVIPAMRYIPSWFPGATFKKLATHWRDLHMKVIVGPYQWAKSHQNSPHLIRPNFTSIVLEQNANMSVEEDEVLMWASASLFGGGADTTVSAISTFFLAMALHPAVQIRAQNEIDEAIGFRLPTLADRALLPYVECIMLEVLRWRPVAPLGIPHLSTKDDTYMGYYIPKGSIVIPNIWDMLHDSSVFPQPERFLPERFLNNSKARDIVKVAFGFGRRACPGESFAESSMFIAYASVLKVISIAYPKDRAGVPLTTTAPYTSGTISHPKPFTCDLAYRSSVHQDLMSFIN